MPCRAPARARRRTRIAGSPGRWPGRPRAAGLPDADAGRAGLIGDSCRNLAPAVAATDCNKQFVISSLQSAHNADSGNADGCVLSMNSCTQMVRFCAPGWPGLRSRLRRQSRVVAGCLLSVAAGWLSEGPRLPGQPPPAAGRRGVDTGPDESNRGCPGSVTAPAVNPVVSAAECLNGQGDGRSG